MRRLLSFTEVVIDSIDLRLVIVSVVIGGKTADEYFLLKFLFFPILY